MKNVDRASLSFSFALLFATQILLLFTTCYTNQQEVCYVIFDCNLVNLIYHKPSYDVDNYDLFSILIDMSLKKNFMICDILLTV